MNDAAAQSRIAPQTSDFAGRVVVVTGAAGGIGTAIARRLAADGARLALLDQRAEPLEDIARALRDDGADAVALPVALSRTADVEAAVASIENELGPIAHLAHAAGILRIGAALTQADADWDACMDANARGQFVVTRAVAQRMAARANGSIVVVGSNAAAVPRAGMAAYGASKAAARYQLQCLGLELAQLGIRCNVVSPGSTDTPMQQAFAPTEADRQRILRATRAVSGSASRWGGSPARRISPTPWPSCCRIVRATSRSTTCAWMAVRPLMPEEVVPAALPRCRDISCCEGIVFANNSH